MARVAMETINGWKVEFEPETGSFYGTAPGGRGMPVVLKRRDLAALRREIGKRTMGRLELMSIASIRPGRYQEMINVPYRRTIVGMEGGQVRTDSGTLESNWRQYARYDAEVVAQIELFRDKLEAARKVVLDEYNRYLEGINLQPLNEDQIKAALVESAKAAEAEVPAS